MNHLVKEALVHVDRDELEEVLVEQRENLDNGQVGNHIKAHIKDVKLKCWNNLIPHVLLHLCLNSSMASHFQEASLPLVEVIE